MRYLSCYTKSMYPKRDNNSLELFTNDMATLFTDIKVNKSISDGNIMKETATYSLITEEEDKENNRWHRIRWCRRTK